MQFPQNVYTKCKYVNVRASDESQFLSGAFWKMSFFLSAPRDTQSRISKPSLLPLLSLLIKPDAKSSLSSAYAISPKCMYEM